jgi:hypothetical protein
LLNINTSRLILLSRLASQFGLVGFAGIFLSSQVSHTLSIASTGFYSLIDKLITSATEVGTRVARFFLVQAYQIGKNISNDHRLYQTAINYTKWP